MLRALVSVAVALLLLVGLFWLFKPATPPAVVATAPLPAPVVATEVAAPAPLPPVAHFALEVADGKLKGEAQSLSLTQGSTVELRLLSDRTGELHLHGYDLELPVKAGEPALLSFSADHAGRFELELHSKAGHVDLGALEVQPQ